jgi:hypothetical protein
VLWLAVAVAMSPTVFDLTRHWLTSEWARYSLVHLALFGVCLYRGPRATPRIRAGYGLIALGVVVQLSALLASVVHVARPGLALAAAGVVLASGAAGWRGAFLASWIIPLPRFVALALGGGDAVVGICSRVGGALAGPDSALVVTLYSMRTDVASLTLTPGQGGPIAVVSLLGLAWFAAERRQLDWLRTLRLGAGFVALALVLQIVSIAAAAAALVGGFAGLAEFMINWASTLAGAALALHISRPGDSEPAVSGRRNGADGS